MSTQPIPGSVSVSIEVARVYKRACHDGYLAALYDPEKEGLRGATITSEVLARYVEAERDLENTEQECSA